jgi:hypothetical protein
VIAIPIPALDNLLEAKVNANANNPDSRVPWRKNKSENQQAAASSRNAVGILKHVRTPSLIRTKRTTGGGGGLHPRRRHRHRLQRPAFSFN